MKINLQARDCVEGMRNMQGLSVDVIVTSPPYNLGKKYNLYEDKMALEDYMAWSESWITEVYKVLKDDGSLFLNVGSASANPTFPFSVLGCATRNGFLLQNTFHWIKSISIEPGNGSETVSYGHFKPINSQRFVNDCHEYVWHLTKRRDIHLDRKAIGVPYQDKSNIERWEHSDGKDVRCRGNCWFIPYETITNADKDRPHPATFPVKLAEMCIKLHGRKNKMVVLDPFVGIGNAALGAKACGDLVEEFIGFDVDPSYIEEAAKRLSIL